MDDEIPCSGIPRVNIPEEIIQEESSDSANHEDVQLEASAPQSFVERIKREISNLNLIALGHLLESEEAATIPDAFKFLENFKFPRTLFTYQPYHHIMNPKIGANAPLNLVLDTLIKNEQEGILVCCFHISDYDIAQSLINTNKKRIPVEIVTNQQQAGDLTAIKLLIQSEISVSCPNSHRYEMNHHKFIIFKRNILNKCLVWHGSYNPTVYSNASSWDDATISDNAAQIQDFKQRFQEIKAVSDPMTLESLPKTH